MNEDYLGMFYNLFKGNIYRYNLLAGGRVSMRKDNTMRYTNAVKFFKEI